MNLLPQAGDTAYIQSAARVIDESKFSPSQGSAVFMHNANEENGSAEDANSNSANNAGATTNAVGGRDKMSRRRKQFKKPSNTDPEAVVSQEVLQASTEQRPSSPPDLNIQPQYWTKELDNMVRFFRFV